MTRIIQSLSEIGTNYDVLYCDLWGCLHNGREAYPAAVKALQAFRQGGGKVCLLTNAPRPASDIQAKMDEMGVPRDAYDLIVSSGDAAQDAMFSGAVGHKVWHLGPPKDDGFFTNVPDQWKDAKIERVEFEEAEGIICTGPFDDSVETPEDYRGRLLLARERGLDLLCANPDIVVDLGDKRIYCAGAIAQAYEELGGTSLYFGKPHPPIYDMARRKLKLREDARILAIGDGIKTDVLGGVQEGIDVIFVTGGLAADQMGDDVENPEPEKVKKFLSDHQIGATYTIGRLR